MSDLGFCVHGHFYQPSREDPITGEIPEERGAFPYKNWNELIFSHCYLPNTELDNFKKISFNFGPTLLNWMGKKYPEIYWRIITQDRENYEKYGVGNALAQPYHHTILPLANREDKITQIRWGIEDYKHRFGHQPAGVWLPETAVDTETLELLVDFGIEFTILAPWQADVEKLDITQPYWVKLSDHKRIAVFFYHQELSTQISFNPMTTINADIFANNFVLPNLIHIGDPKRPKYLLLASDGELYGHHQPFRDKFLAHLMNGSLSNKNISQIFPGLWLKENPPKEYIKIKEKTSWSCHHGVSRWSTGCECTPHSEWKNSLRKFIDRVSEIVNEVYQTEMSRYTADIWELRHRFIDVILDRKPKVTYIREVIDAELDGVDELKLDNLLSAQYERQRMYTSCGWFFEDFDRIEPQNVIAYAAQAIYWTQQVSGKDYLPELLPLLRDVHSHNNNLNGEDVFRRFFERSSIMVQDT
jgi:hypothetical protein